MDHADVGAAGDLEAAAEADAVDGGDDGDPQQLEVSHCARQPARQSLLTIIECGLERLDVGSGGGFPGLVVAILAAEKAPGLRVTLVDSDLRKAAFLTTVVRELGLNTTVCSERIESLAPLGADVLSARALAPLPQLLAYAARHLAEGGLAILPKGATHERELASALEHWRFSVQKHPSRTDPDAVLLVLGDITRV